MLGSGPSSTHLCRCARCRYVSYSTDFGDCNWFSTCDLGALNHWVGLPSGARLYVDHLSSNVSGQKAPGGEGCKGPEPSDGFQFGLEVGLGVSLGLGMGFVAFRLARRYLDRF